MRSALPWAALLVLTGCSDKTPALPKSAPAASATTNAKVEPVPVPTTSTPSPPSQALPADTLGSELPAAPGTGCGLDKASSYVGRKADAAARAQVTAAVRERRIRWTGPNDGVTMDFDESRLNMMLDAGGTIIAAKCG
ncbi:MAG: I78 family peptidase inhibitor [Novosphingobium sp.]